MRDLQPTDECEFRDILAVIGDLGRLALKEAGARFEAVTQDLRLSPCLILTMKRWWLFLLTSR